MNAATSLEDTIVLASGAGGGIGRAVVRRLLEGGATVLAADLPGSDITSGELAGLVGDRLVLCEYDVATPSGAEKFVQEALNRWSQVDGLVNVAGAWLTRPFLEITEADLDHMVDANFKTAFYPSQAVARAMLTRGAGSIVHFASTAGEYGSIAPGAHYAAAKGAVIALTKSMARELSPHGVRVNAISPGPIDTSALSGGANLDRGTTAQRTLFGRLGRPEEIAEAAVFLVSLASSFITGQVLGVNGGSRL